MFILLVGLTSITWAWFSDSESESSTIKSGHFSVSMSEYDEEKLMGTAIEGEFVIDEDKLCNPQMLRIVRDDDSLKNGYIEINITQKDVDEPITQKYYAIFGDNGGEDICYYTLKIDTNEASLISIGLQSWNKFKTDADEKPANEEEVFNILSTDQEDNLNEIVFGKFNIVYNSNVPDFYVGEKEESTIEIKDIPYVSSHMYLLKDGSDFSFDGYEFVGWSLTKDGDILQINQEEDEYKGYTKIDKTPASEGLNLYAIWKPIEYTLEYDANGGAFASTGDSIKINDKEYTILTIKDNETHVVSKDKYGDAISFDDELSDYINSNVDEKMNEYYDSLDPSIKDNIIEKEIDVNNWSILEEKPSNGDYYEISYKEDNANKVQYLVSNAKGLSTTKKVYPLAIEELLNYLSKDNSIDDIKKLFDIADGLWLRSYSNEKPVALLSKGYFGCEDISNVHSIYPSFVIKIDNIDFINLDDSYNSCAYTISKDDLWLPTNIYKKGYDFVGWFSKDGANGDWGEEIDSLDYAKVSTLKNEENKIVLFARYEEKAMIEEPSLEIVEEAKEEIIDTINEEVIIEEVEEAKEETIQEE